DLTSFPTRRSSDLAEEEGRRKEGEQEQRRRGEALAERDRRKPVEQRQGGEEAAQGDRVGGDQGRAGAGAEAAEQAHGPGVEREEGVAVFLRRQSFAALDVAVVGDRQVVLGVPARQR